MEHFKTAQEYYDQLPNPYTKGRIQNGENVVVKCSPEDSCAVCCRGFRVELAEMAEHFGMDIQKIKSEPITISEPT